MKNFTRIALAAFGLISLSACTDPYDPGQRALGGAAIGAGGGAAIGALAGGGHGAALGALLGGGAGALTGVVTTPQRPDYYSYGPSPTYYNTPPRYYDRGYSRYGY